MTINKKIELKNGENSGNFPKLEKPKIWVIGNVIRKAHANFQEIPKNREELYNDVNIA